MLTMHRVRRLLAFLVLLVVGSVVLSACGDSGGDAGGGTPRGDGSGRAPLEGPTWVLDQRASGFATTATSIRVTAVFDGGRVSGHSGCNRYSAAYEVRGRSLTLSPVAGTRMACEPPASTVEDEYLARLERVRSFAIAGDRLTLTPSGSGGALVFGALDPEEAIAGSWEVISYYRSDAVVSVITGTTITARFEDGTVSGSTGCNEYSGSYEVDGRSITIGPLRTTRRACVDAAAGKQESDYLAALELARSFSLDGSNLTLLREGGTIAVVYAPA
ncbi:MAG: hypothetical protein AMXMBFR46_28470 [Acidimicrobiia bacterium]